MTKSLQGPGTVRNTLSPT